MEEWNKQQDIILRLAVIQLYAKKLIQLKPENVLPVNKAA